ncbi:MAG: radical SAM protein, partial [Spirochaetota bacterium]
MISPGNSNSSSSKCTKGKIPEKFYIENLGCAKNQVDAEVMLAALEHRGLIFTPSPDKADIIIVNTCGFIQSAKEESIQMVIAFKDKYPGKSIILAGCLAERYGGALEKQLPEVDGFFGNREPSRIADLLAPEGFADGRAEQFFRNRILSLPGSVYVKIAEGCNNRCSYCAIPLIRGELRSRNMNDLLKELTTFIQAGFSEINLVAQDLGSYGTDRGQAELNRLLQSISAVEGDFWIRLLYIHPDHFPLEILNLISADMRILPYFDIPFQHASEKILKGMGRKGNSTTYLR